MARIFLLCLAAPIFALSVLAQTITTTDQDGNTIVEVITVDPNLGLPTTEIIQTLPPGLSIPPAGQSSSSSLPVPPVVPPAIPSTSAAPPLSLAPVTAPDVQQGPVGAPTPTTGPQGPVVYTYTTTDVNGATIAVVDTFTPTSPASTPFTPPTTGTILNYSSWVQMVGTNTVGPINVSASSHLTVSRHVLGATLGVVVGLLGGVGLVLA